MSRPYIATFGLVKAFSRTAIVFFSLSAEREAVRKPLLNGFSEKSNEELYGRMLDRTIAVCEETDLPFFHFDENLQRGKTFGNRFCNAIEDAFDFGYERLIIIGNDAPDISPTNLIDCARTLEEGRSMLYPSQKGGFSILSIRRKDYDRLAFSKVKWCSDNAFDTMLTVLGKSCEVGTELKEINDYIDLLEYADTAEEYSDFLVFVRGLISPFLTFEPTNEESFSLQSFGGLGFRGPPFKA